MTTLTRKLRESFKIVVRLHSIGINTVYFRSSREGKLMSVGGENPKLYSPPSNINLQKEIGHVTYVHVRK